MMLITDFSLNEASGKDSGSTGFQPVNAANAKNSSNTGFQIVNDTTAKETGNTGFQPVNEFRIYKRNLPHWEWPGSVYFITFRTAMDFILPEKARDIVSGSITFNVNRKYHLYAFVVMPDHVHIILQPLEKIKKAFYSLAEIMHSIKSFTANQINKLLNRKGPLWLDENFDRIIRDEGEFLEKLHYVLNNPVKSGFAEKPQDYKWLYVEGWINVKLQARTPVPPK